MELQQTPSRQYSKPDVRERKKTGVHGTLEMIPLTWKLNSKQLLSKTLNSRINIIETRAVLNIVKTDRKWFPEGKREGLELNRRCFFSVKNIDDRGLKKRLK